MSTEHILQKYGNDPNASNIAQRGEEGKKLWTSYMVDYHWFWTTFKNKYSSLVLKSPYRIANTSVLSKIEGGKFQFSGGKLVPCVTPKDAHKTSIVLEKI